MSWPRFESSINLGHVLTIVSILLGGLAAYNGIVVRVSAAEIRVQALEKTQNDIATALRDLAAVQRDVAVIRDRLDRASVRN